MKCCEIVLYKFWNNIFEMFDFNKLKVLILDIYNYFMGIKFLKVKIIKRYVIKIVVKIVFYLVYFCFGNLKCSFFKIFKLVL